MKTLLCILILTGATFAQELKPTALTPVRISIASDVEATPTDKEFNELLSRELGKGGGVAFTSTRFDAKVLTSSTPITSKGKASGFATATAILTRAGGEFSLRLHVASATTLDELAEDAAKWLDKELSTIRKGKSSANDNAGRQ